MFIKMDSRDTNPIHKIWSNKSVKNGSFLAMTPTYFFQKLHFEDPR